MTRGRLSEISVLLATPSAVSPPTWTVAPGMPALDAAAWVAVSRSRVLWSAARPVATTSRTTLRASSET